MRPVLIAVLSLSAACNVRAQMPQTTMTPAAYTGLGITPNAHLLGWGRLEFTYDNQLPGIPSSPSGHNYVLGIGLLPNLEIAGRLAANSPQNSNCFEPPGCGVRDLSASAKAGIGLDAAGRFRIAAGITDVGGAVTYFRSYYGVATYNNGPLEVSAGLAHRAGRGINNSRSPLDGPFAAAAWQPVPWVRGQLEYTDSNAWAGLRLFAPKEWVPEGWSAYIGANHRLTGTNLTERAWWTAGVSIPLYKVPTLRGTGGQAPLPTLTGAQQPLPAYEARTLPRVSVGTASGLLPLAVSGSQPIDDAMLLQLAAALRSKGLEDLWVGRMADASIAVRANNATYNWNSVDALGAAFAAIAQTLGNTKTAYRLILTQRQVPLVAVTGQADCLRLWIQGDSAACAAGELSTPGTMALDRLHEGASWVVARQAPSWQTLRVSISPILRTNVGSEFGVLDYSLGANIGVLLPLWSGASVEARHDVPLAHTSDYEGSEIFADRRVRSRLERLAFTQTLRLPVERWLGADDVAIRRWGLASVTGQASIGRFGGYFDGLHGALRWEPGEGVHRLGAEAGWFRNADFGAVGARGARVAKPFLAHYRYHFSATRTYLEASAGNFMNNDAGFQVGMRQWFSDVAVQLYYKRTHFENSPARQFVGLQISVPIGPRRDMSPAGHVQVTGTPRFSHGVETTVREGGSNPVRLGYGAVPRTSSLEGVFNSDRAGLIYFEDNTRRVRDAAR